jgi:uncharacterized protein (TIGR00251 family)
MPSLHAKALGRHEPVVPTWRDAVQPQGEQTRILLEVTAGARVAAFPDGYNPWRNRIGIRVRAAAQKGEANAEVVRTIAGIFGLGSGTVAIASGHLDSRKDVVVDGIHAAAAQERLAAAFAEAL